MRMVYLRAARTMRPNRTCVGCGAHFRSRKTASKFCSRTCMHVHQARPGSPVLTTNTGFVLGVFRFPSRMGSCHCGADATRMLAAVLNGDLIVVGVCEQHARAAADRTHFQAPITPDDRLHTKQPRDTP